MDAPSRRAPCFRFAEFEFRGETGELWSQGQNLHLTDQAGLVLEALLKAQGGLVSREDLKKVLWPDKTFGDLEGGLNAAVRKLRQALKDDGAEPRIIGTLPKRGYRMLVFVEPGQDPEAGPDGRKAARGSWVGVPRNRTLWLGSAVFALAAAMGMSVWLHFHPSGYPVGRSPGELWRDTASGLTFVWIPAGTFLMGSPVEEKGRNTDENQHPVTLSRGFWMGKYEVTQAQYAAVMGTNPSHFKDSGPEAPVESVNWEDAQSFVRALSARVKGRAYRLPTEAEWEYACRAGSTTSTYGPLGSIAWNAYASGLKPHPVGQKQPNAWGLHDMIGNVYEWCQDCYKDPYDTSLDADPVGPPSNRYHAIRGGSWQSGTTQSRAAFRASEELFELRYPFVGLRVVCVPLQAPP